MKHVEAVHPEVTAVDVGGRVALGVSDMKACSRRIGEHVEDVGPLLLGIGGVFCDCKGFMLCPILLPLRLCLCKWIAAHSPICYIYRAFASNGVIVIAPSWVYPFD